MSALPPVFESIGVEGRSADSPRVAPRRRPVPRDPTLADRASRPPRPRHGPHQFAAPAHDRPPGRAARQFLTAHKVSEEQIQAVWEAIALHTTPGVTQYMRPEVALLYSGVGLDVLGRGLEQFPSELRDQIVAMYPRRNFKEGMVQALLNGYLDKPGASYGTVIADICERFIPGYKSPDACDLMAASPFPDSASES